MYAAGLIAVVSKATGEPCPVRDEECPACGLAFGTLAVIGLMPPPQEADDNDDALVGSLPEAYDMLVPGRAYGFRNHGARIGAKMCGAHCLACDMGLRGVPVGHRVWCSIVRKFSTSAEGGKRWTSRP